MFMLLTTLAVVRLPTEKRIVVEKPKQVEWAESFQTAVVQKQIVTPKQDREPIRQIPITAPAPPVQRVVAEVPAKAPPVVQEEEERPRRRSAEGGDICTRHGMHKVITRGGKSWRCRR
jgi:hypothetical protein